MTIRNAIIPLLATALFLTACSTLPADNNELSSKDFKINRPVIALQEESFDTIRNERFKQKITSLYKKSIAINDGVDYDDKLACIESALRESEALHIDISFQDDESERSIIKRLEAELNIAYRRATLWKELESAVNAPIQNKNDIVEYAANLEGVRNAAEAIINSEGTIFSSPDTILAKKIMADAQLLFNRTKADLALIEIEKAHEKSRSPKEATEINDIYISLIRGLLENNPGLNFKERQSLQSKLAETLANKDQLLALDKKLKDESKRDYINERKEFIKNLATQDLEFAKAAYNQLASQSKFNIDMEGRTRLVNAIVHCDRVIYAPDELSDTLRQQGSALREKCWELGLSTRIPGTSSGRARELYKITKPLKPYNLMENYPAENIEERVSQKWQVINLT